MIVDLFMRLVVQSAVDALMKKKYGDSVTLGRRHAAQAAAAPTLAEDPEQLHFEQQQGRRGHGDTNKGADADQHRQSGRPVAGGLVAMATLLVRFIIGAVSLRAPLASQRAFAPWQVVRTSWVVQRQRGRQVAPRHKRIRVLLPKQAALHAQRLAEHLRRLLVMARSSQRFRQVAPRLSLEFVSLQCTVPPHLGTQRSTKPPKRRPGPQLAVGCRAATLGLVLRCSGPGCSGSRRTLLY